MDYHGRVPKMILNSFLDVSCCISNVLMVYLAAGAHVTEVHFTLNREGRPSGEAYIAFADENSYQTALGKDRDNMGHRYIEGQCAE